MSEFPALIEKYIRDKQNLKGLEYDPEGWLDSASKRASQISVATHVLKYTHGDAKGTNIWVKEKPQTNDGVLPYVTTESLKDLKNDISVRNAAALDIVGLLELPSGGEILLDLLARNDSSPFTSFTSCENKLAAWMTGLRSVLVDPSLKSHSLAKQVYFPVGSEGYHLLGPLFPSSLAHNLYEKVQNSRFSETAKKAREARKKDEFSDETLTDFPDLAIQSFGGSKPQNISRLNNLRRGKVYLLGNAPPVWKTIKKPPYHKNSFWRLYESKSFSLIKELKSYLKSVKKLNNNKEIRLEIRSYVDQLLDILLYSSAEIQALKTGWSKDCLLPLEEQIWLDPHREDFILSQRDSAWRELIATRFARWVIQKLETEELKFSDVNHAYLADCCLGMLKEGA